MRIENNVMYYKNPKFTGFSISYNAEELLSKLPNDVLAKILDVGRKIERAEYVELQLLSDLRFRIKEKGKVFSGFTEPVKVLEPKVNENHLTVVGIYDGVESDDLKRGKPCKVSIRYASYAEALKGYNMIQSSKTNIEKLGAIANEIERDKAFLAEKELLRTYNNKKRTPLSTVLISKYGNFVKEFKD